MVGFVFDDSSHNLLFGIINVPLQRLNDSQTLLSDAFIFIQAFHILQLTNSKFSLSDKLLEIQIHFFDDFGSQSIDLIHNAVGEHRYLLIELALNNGINTSCV